VIKVPDWEWNLCGAHDIKMDLKDMGCEGVDWVPVYTAMNLPVPQN
jgi:hypothetical protein